MAYHEIVFILRSSIISQDIENCEILLVDDGSTDKSGEICDEYSKKYDFIKVIHQENKGLAAVRNRCVQEAEGEYISFIDSDDYILPGAYTYFKKVIKNENWKSWRSFDSVGKY